MHITPKLDPKGKGYRIFFRHPQTKKPIARGLGTREDIEAQAICRDIEALCSLPQLLQAPYSPELRGYERRAVEVILGDKVAEEVFKDVGAPFTADDLKDIQALHEEADTIAKIDARDVGIRHTREDVAEHFAHDMVRFFEPRAWRELNEYLRKLEKELKVLKPRCEYLETEVARLQRLQNAKVKAKIGEAVVAWLPVYKQYRSSHAYNRAVKATKSFMASLPKQSDMKLGDIRTAQIDEWVEKLKGEEGQEISARTKQKQRNFLSMFFRWATKKYDLVENPMTKVEPIPGAQRPPDHIVAIRRIEDLHALLDGLKPWPYWKAFVATAILQGPRYAEQVWLKLDDVFLAGDGDYLCIRTRTSGRRVMGTTKTGRERNVPLEKTTLLSILKEYIESRKLEQVRPGATEAQKSAWLFPSTVPDGPVKRTKTPAGIWSHNRSFQNAWQAAAIEAARRAGVLVIEEKDTWKEKLEKLRNLAGTSFEYWTYGPDEWRHCFGTALANSGLNSLEISRMMGNRPDVADKYYIATASTGSRWPFLW
ncbi:MAG TPA: tyrosine-type recombinase/integrase [Planctomycetota bacterium]